MHSENQVSRKSFWAGWVLTVLVTLLLIFDGMTKVLQMPFVMEATAKAAFPLHLFASGAVMFMICTALYLIPRTSILGAILLTGYLGGAVLSNLRDGLPFFSLVLLPVYIGVFVWAAIYLRDGKLRALIPLRS